MKRIAGVLAGASLLCVHAFAQSITLENSARTNEIIDLAYAAHGGETGLDALETVFIEQSEISYSVEQSRAAEPPWDRGHAAGFHAIDVVEQRYVNRFEGTSGGFENHSSTVINGEDSAQINYRAGTAATITEPDFDAATAAFTRVTPALLVRALKNRSANAYYLGEATLDGTEYNVLGFSMTVGPAITLYFDKESHLLRRSERVFAGAGVVEYEFDDYALEKGIPFNRAFRLFLEGDPNLEREILSVRVNEPIDKLLDIDSRLERVAAQESDSLKRQEISEGVWLIGGNGTYAMFVDMGDYVFAAGATNGIAERIRLLREVVERKPVRFAMLTHHHFDHVMGVQDYVREGATLIASAAHSEVARRAATDPASVEIVEVGDSYELPGSVREVQIIDVGPTAHTEHLLVAYLPDEKILFEGDHFAMPQTGPVPPAVSSTRTFAEALADAGIDVQYFLSEHSSRVGRPADLQRALEQKLFQADN